MEGEVERGVEGGMDGGMEGIEGMKGNMEEEIIRERKRG